jgi:multidrug efflux system membrane fusion protein
MEENSPASNLRSNETQVQPRPAHSAARKVVAWVVVLVLFAGLFTLVLRNKGTTQTAGPGAKGRPAMMGSVAVVAATATKGDIGVYQEAIGTVTPVYTSSITAQVTGVIIAVHYREGQLVRKGDPLIDIDPRPFQAQLAQAEGTLEKDKQLLAQATMDLERYRAAWQRNAVAKQTLDDQEKLVLQDQGTVKADQGTVDYYKVQISFCHITAPYNGRVGLRLVDPGNIVQANGTNPLVVITQEQPTTVIFTLAEDAIGQLHDALRRGAHLTVDAYDRAAMRKIATGTLLTVDNQIDTTTGTVKLRAQFDNKDGALFPNQFVNTRLLMQTLKDVTLIPTSAIQHNGQVAFVYVIQNDTAVMRNVTPGAVDAGMTAVGGVQPGEVIANSSFEKLQPNAKVKITQAVPSASQSSAQPSLQGGAPGGSTTR